MKDIKVITYKHKLAVKTKISLRINFCFLVFFINKLLKKLLTIIKAEKLKNFQLRYQMYQLNENKYKEMKKEMKLTINKVIY